MQHSKLVQVYKSICSTRNNMLFILSPKTRRCRCLRWLYNNSISLENQSKMALEGEVTPAVCTYIILNDIYRGLKYHVENIYGDDVTITIYRLVPDYVVGRSASRC